MECPKCATILNLLETDDSSWEWREETYYCEECKKSFLRRIEFQTQSYELIESDTLTEIIDCKTKDKLQEIMEEKLKQIKERKNGTRKHKRN